MRQRTKAPGWMAGVLAAQIQGGVVVVQLLGLAGWKSHVLVLALIFGASPLALGFASKLFAACLLASALVLVWALFAAGGLQLYLLAVPSVVHDLSTFSGARVLAIMMAVALLVRTGADDHQFAFAARRPGAAVLGCALAGLALLLVSSLPPAAGPLAQRALQGTKGPRARGGARLRRLSRAGRREHISTAQRAAPPEPQPGSTARLVGSIRQNPGSALMSRPKPPHVNGHGPAEPGPRESAGAKPRVFMSTQRCAQASLGR